MIRSYDAGVKVRCTTMDGTAHNTSTFKLLGCNLLPKKISAMRVEFPHPSPQADYKVCGMLDPPHMIKLVRNMLAEYWELHWPNKGTVKWAYIVRLHETQKSHQGVRLANTFGKDCATIKVPCTPDGLRACKMLKKELIRVNVTLIFDAAQATIYKTEGTT